MPRKKIYTVSCSLPADIVLLSPSHNKVPECRVPRDAARDYFLERVTRVDADHWEPVLTLMHQFAEMFNYFDYVTLGAKISKYLENVSNITVFLVMF